MNLNRTREHSHRMIVKTDLRIRLEIDTRRRLVHHNDIPTTQQSSSERKQLTLSSAEIISTLRNGRIERHSHSSITLPLDRHSTHRRSSPTPSRAHRRIHLDSLENFETLSVGVLVELIDVGPNGTAEEYCFLRDQRQLRS